MIKRFLVLIAALVLVMSACMTSALAYDRMYVKTGNGKTLNVRSEPTTAADNVILKFPYGTEVVVDYHLGNGWTCIMLAGQYDAGYVQTKFLVSSNPGKYVPSSADADLAKPATSKDSYTIEQLNNVLATGHKVNSYMVTLYPTRSSGWVYLRWVPSRTANQLAKYGSGKEVRVIAELKDWYQVQDPDTGAVGFVYTSYVH